jgi:DNA replication protein DnaC
MSQETTLTLAAIVLTNLVAATVIMMKLNAQARAATEAKQAQLHAREAELHEQLSQLGKAQVSHLERQDRHTAELSDKRAQLDAQASALKEKNHSLETLSNNLAAKESRLDTTTQQLAKTQSKLTQKEQALRTERAQLIDAGKALEKERESWFRQHAQADRQLKSEQAALNQHKTILRWSHNPHAHAALAHLTQTNKNLILTGSAGTGKTTLINQWRSLTTPPPVVVAFTGIAALQAGGQTIHSFFKFNTNKEPILPEDDPSSHESGKFNELHTLIIDEISMVRADMMAGIERRLRKHGPCPGSPFGGVRIILVGDMYQLPPIVKGPELQAYFAVNDSGDGYPSKFWFDSMPNHTWESIELTHSYRQGTEEQQFLAILHRARLGLQTEQDISTLNERLTKTPNETTLWLTTTKQTAADRNAAKLATLPGDAVLHRATIQRRHNIIQVRATPKNEDNYPAPVLLNLKANARVIFVKNDPETRWVNGEMGTVVDPGSHDGKTPVRVRMDRDTRPVYPIAKDTWQVVSHRYNKDSKEWETIVEYEFIQYPIDLGWARTIHKAQGQSYAAAHIHTGTGAFADGQIYVALSRLRTLTGLTLHQPLRHGDFKVNPRVHQWIHAHTIHTPLAKLTPTRLTALPAPSHSTQHDHRNDAPPHHTQ